MENYEWKLVYVSIIVTVFFAVICFTAFTFIDGMSGGYAIGLVSLFIAISGIVVAGLFFHRAHVMDEILKSNQLLAHWLYSPEIAQENAYREHNEYIERNRAMFILIGGMLVVTALIFILFVEDGGLITGIFLIVFTIVLFIISRITPGLELNRALKTPHEAYIARNGIIYEGSVYPFQSFMMGMFDVYLQKGTDKKKAALVFSFTQLVGFYVIQAFDIIVPIPDGELDAAYGIVHELGGEDEGEKK
jgi:hypothetical protein